MNLLNRLRIGSKLGGGFAVIVILLLGVSAMGVLGIGAINSRLTSMYNDRTIPIEKLGQVNTYIFRIPGDLFKFMQIPNPSNKQAGAAASDLTVSASSNSNAVSGQLLDCTTCHTNMIDDPKMCGTGVPCAKPADCAACHQPQAYNISHTTGGAAQTNNAVAPSSATGQQVAVTTDDSNCSRCHSDAVINTQLTNAQAAISSNRTKINSLMDEFRALSHSEEEQQELANFDVSWEKLQKAIDDAVQQTLNNQARTAMHSVTGGDVYRNQQAVERSIEKLIQINETEAVKSQQSGDATYQQNFRLLLAVSAAGLLIAIMLGLVLTGNLNRPLREMASAAHSLASGEFNRGKGDPARQMFTRRLDEVGEVGSSIVETEVYLQEMADVARRISQGDLTVNVQPKSGQDELGTSFEVMIVSLRKLVEQIAENATMLSAAATQVVSAAEQVENAAGQISDNLGEVSSGAEEQSTSLAVTTQSVQELMTAIHGTTQGAQEQARAIDGAAQVTNGINQSIQQIIASVQAGRQGATQAADIARTGGQTVAQAMEGMHAIREKVGFSAQKVAEMGTRSEQIGSIVETIEDIASQTNLLALNAAIEAARAGEQGRGFAVVAAEVGRLAERSSVATREISELIKSIQGATAEAVQAMQEGAGEVENGVRLVNESGQALEHIQASVLNLNQQVELIDQSAQQIGQRSGQLVGNMNTVSQVVDRNTATLEKMAMDSDKVNRANQGVLQISRRSVNAVLKAGVSGSELQEQVAQFNASAQMLVELAGALEEAVASFRV